MSLTNTECKNAKAKEKSYKLFDGGGLYLEVMPSGKKLWRLKYYYLKTEKRISFGAYPLVSLQEAREKRDAAKKLLLDNQDPSNKRREEAAELKRNADNSFRAVALEWFDVKKVGWKEKYEQKNKRILENDLFPALGARPIKDIKPPELLEVLRKIEGRKAFNIAKKARQLAGMVFNYGIQTGKCEWNAAANLNGALKPVKTVHHRALSEERLPDFLRALERNEPCLNMVTRRAIWFSLLTFQRPGEIRQAQWSEINWDAAEWRLSADKMKMKRDHKVFLSNQALEILREQQDAVSHLNTDWVFPARTGHKKPMSDATVNKAIQALGFGAETTAHGFRALARTVIDERLKFNPEVIERALAHKTNNALGEAYDRSQYIEERRIMMQAWASHLDALLIEDKVIVGKFGVI